MSVSRFLKEIGRPVAYYPRLANAIESVKATVFLCQLLYWQGKGHDPEGWIYKKQDEIEMETGLTRRKQESARRILVKLGLLDEQRKGTHGTLHFRVNLEALDSLWSKHVSANGVNVQRSMAESANDERRKAPNANGASGHTLIKDSETTTENTTETTGEDTARERAEGSPPEWIDPKLWRRWVNHRKEIKHPVTTQQAEAQFRVLDKFRARGMPPEDVIEQSIANGWQGLFELKGSGNGNGRSGKQSNGTRANDPVRSQTGEVQGNYQQRTAKNRI